jgi:hypothetical protein
VLSNVDKLRYCAVVRIARRAGGDDESSPDEDEDGEGLTEEQRAARRQKKQEKMAIFKSKLGFSSSARCWSTKLCHM